MGVDAFSSSDEAFAADALFLSYADGNAEKVKALVQVGRGWARVGPVGLEGR
jgi:hypothetical protein